MDPRRSGEARPQSAVTGVAGNNTNSLLNTVLVVLLILTSVVATVYLVSRLLGGHNGGAVKSGSYQALFLTNGQVYFGHLSKVDNSYVQMKDIYYLQVQQQVQPGNATTNSSQQVSLAKLGSELHGPEDIMYVSHDQVLFWENLKSDGKVTQAIKDYQGGKK